MLNFFFRPIDSNCGMIFVRNWKFLNRLVFPSVEINFSFIIIVSNSTMVTIETKDKLGWD